MRIFPIIPIWIITIICIILIIFIFKYKRGLTQVAIVVLLFCINLRVMIVTNNSTVLANNLDVLFVIDNTISMTAEDYKGEQTRLSAVKEDCKYIIEELSGANFSVITFNNKAKRVTPYTKDTNMTIEAIELVEPINEFYAKGSSLNTPLETMVVSLKTSQDKGDRVQILFFISDGEITDNSTLNSFKELFKYVDGGAVLGYGTTNGGKMKIKDQFSENESYLMDTSDYNYKIALSKIDENNLKQIARDANIDYINMNKQNNINSKLRKIKNSVKNSIEKSDKTSYTDTYYFLVIPLLILLMIEFNKFKGRNIK